ncbi:carboxypeptidase-like regulatory domain-containing protein [uncultured Paludibaculum sp.]|uniref:TonB-dependent receptor n=1 Tax=uncultured Paludibaculum sp. TaxID=1765020 RepID=UPI002AAC278D|nr:carboxypeptidase-like regulatory domain-containing protein [uncultured Paludibaculum sp.]
MKRLLLGLVGLLALHLTAWGQAATQVSGVVTDSSGAVVPAAVVDLENVDTSLKRSTAADQSGSYAFLQVVPGKYRITVKATGFRTSTVNGVQLLVNNPATVNIKLEVGQLSETVAVVAETENLNTVDASVGNAIGNKPIVQLPLNARNIVGLLALQPGVVFTKEDDTDSRNGAVNGGKSDQANVTLDGIDVNDQMDRNAFTSVLRMTPDSVQEFRVTTLNANADSGRSSGAQVVMMTKSGTNDLHGSLYEYHRNTITTANGFFNNKAGIERPKLIRNIFGASLGGPIKRNKMFVFGNWEGRRDAKDGTDIRDVPSMDMRQGILHYEQEDGSLATVTPADIKSLVDARGVNQNVLAMLQKYPEPNDFSVGDGMNLAGYRFKASTPLRWNTYIAKFDWMLDSQAKHTLFVRGNLQNDNEQGLPQFPGQPANSVLLRNNKGYGIGLTSVFRPTFVSNFRYGLTRQGFETTGIANFSAVTLRGIDPPVGLTRGAVSIIPVHTLSEDLNWIKGSHTIQFGGIARFNQNKRNNLANSFSSATANASWLTSSGADLTAPFENLPSSQYTNFRYAMTDVLGLVTQGNAQYNYKVDGTVLPEGAPVVRNFKNQEYEFYLQDTWHVSRALTVTGGIRYSLMPPIYEANGQQVSPNIPIGDWFNMRGGLAQQGLSQMGAGLISFIPKSAGGRDLYPFHKDNWAPRISMAYSPQGDSGLSKFLFGGPGKTSIRAGWGMFYDLFGSGLMRSYDATAFGLSNALTNPAATLDISSAPRFTAIDQIPAGLLPAAPAATFPATYPNLFAITNGLDDTLKAPYNMNMNFSIGRELSHGWFVQGSYVGRLSRRSLTRRDAAMPTDLKDPKSGQTYFQAASILAQQVLDGVPVGNVQKVPFWENMFSKAATGTQSATQVVYNRYAANTYDWTYALYQLDTGAGQGNCAVRLRCSDQGAYTFYSPQFSYLSVFSSVGGGSYHGAQLNVRKRFGNGDVIDVNYTFSKSIDLRSNTERAGSSTGVLWNPWQPGLMKGVSDYDNTHLFNMLAVYNLPVGRGKRFATDIPRWADAAIGGWQLSGVWRWSSGFPISVFETGVWPTNWNNNNWARWTGAPVSTQHGENMFASPDSAINAFDYELPGGIGTRNGLRGDGIFNIDLNLSKRFVMPFNEKHSLQFRWETFNLTNTTRFDVNSASLDISTGGTFGAYSELLTSPRVMQFGLRYEF